MSTSLIQIKQRFGLIGSSPQFERAIEKAAKVASTDISVLVSGESGVGKESIPRIIHAFSHRKHKPYIAVNCGAIPEGTIDSELFGHEKGSFTGATGTRKGYFEEAHEGTIFLDEVAELPLSTQVRLLRVLETGEFIKVGSSKTQKTNVRIVAATNENMLEAVQKGKFREDLYYRLNTIEINLPPLREREDDIPLLFRKFCLDFSEKYRSETVRLTDEAVEVLKKYRWPGNIRQLRNLAEQISVVEQNREISAEKLSQYLPQASVNRLPATAHDQVGRSEFNTEREILYKILFDMRNDINDLKKLTMEMLKNGDSQHFTRENSKLIRRVFDDEENTPQLPEKYQEREVKKEEVYSPEPYVAEAEEEQEDFYEEVHEENLSLEDNEKGLIRKSLERNQGRRKAAAEELGISERTLYRKIKQYGL